MNCSSVAEFRVPLKAACPLRRMSWEDAALIAAERGWWLLCRRHDKPRTCSVAFWVAESLVFPYLRTGRVVGANPRAGGRSALPPKRCLGAGVVGGSSQACVRDVHLAGRVGKAPPSPSFTFSRLQE